MAQETYDNAQLATKDLNGTARYVGMGGAMEALGADITTMNTNPAGRGSVPPQHDYRFVRFQQSVGHKGYRQGQNKGKFRPCGLCICDAFGQTFVCQLRRKLHKESQLQPDYYGSR